MQGGRRRKSPAVWCGDVKNDEQKDCAESSERNKSIQRLFPFVPQKREKKSSSDCHKRLDGDDLFQRPFVFLVQVMRMQRFEHFVSIRLHQLWGGASQ